MLFALAATALAAPALVDAPEPRVWVGVSLAGSLGASEAPHGGGGAGVEAGARVGKEARRSVGLVARAHESVLAGPLRNIGNIEVQVQYPAGTGPYALVGFSHNHEALADHWLHDPVGHTAGVADTLRHRTGFEVGVGWMLAPPYRETTLSARFRPTFALAAHVFPDKHEPLVYAVGEFTLRFALDGPW